MISIVFPAYNEEENVARLHGRLVSVMESLNVPYEIIAVDNGSTDQTFKKLTHLSPIKIVVIKKNVGQTAGLDAGFNEARGDIIVTLDADLQNDPEDIPLLINKLDEGYDVVSGWRSNRKDSFGRRLLSRAANRLTGWITGLYLHDSACALKAYRKSELVNLNLYGEMHVFLPAILHAQGSRVAEVEVRHHDRVEGKSKHNFLKAVKDIGDLLVIKFMNDFMARPFLLFGGAGIILFSLGVLSGCASITLKVMEIRNFGQTPLPILATLLIVVGMLLFMMGFLAEMLLRIYYESKGAKPYRIKEILSK